MSDSQSLAPGLGAECSTTRNLSFETALRMSVVNVHACQKVCTLMCVCVYVCARKRETEEKKTKKNDVCQFL